MSVLHQKNVKLLDSAGICGRPRTSHGVRLLGNSFLDGDRVTFSCDKNLDLFGKAKLRCVGRAWDSSEPECKGEQSLELIPCKKKRKKKEKKKGAVTLTCQAKSLSKGSILQFCSVFLALALLQSLIRLVSDNFIRDKEEAKKQNELKMSIKTRVMRGVKLAIQAFNPILSPYKC